VGKEKGEEHRLAELDLAVVDGNLRLPPFEQTLPAQQPQQLDQPEDADDAQALR